MEHSYKTFVDSLMNNRLPEYFRKINLPPYLSEEVIKDHDAGVSPVLLSLRIYQYIHCLNDLTRTPEKTLEKLEAELLANIDAKKQAEDNIRSIMIQIESIASQRDLLVLTEKYNFNRPGGRCQGDLINVNQPNP